MEFADQNALQNYAELHGLAYMWEGMAAFRKRLATLAPEQYELVEVRTKRGVTRALLFPNAILQAEFEADAPMREALAIKRAVAAQEGGQ
jgi:acyl carrier protein phosphodiesterase